MKNQIISKILGLGTKKLIVIGVCGVVVVGGGTAAIVHYNTNDSVKAASNVDEKISIDDLTERYNDAMELLDNLILEEDAYSLIQKDLSKIKLVIDKNEITKTTTKDMTTIENNLAGYEKESLKILEEKESSVPDYTNFEEEIKNNISSMFDDYNSLKGNGKYKDANNKIDEIINYINGILNPENETETINYTSSLNVLEEETEKTGGNNSNSGSQSNSNSSGNTGNSNTSNSNNSNGSNGSNNSSGSNNNQETTQQVTEDWRVTSIKNGEVNTPQIGLWIVDVLTGQSTMEELQSKLNSAYPSYGFIATTKEKDSYIWNNPTSVTYTGSACDNIFYYIP